MKKSAVASAVATALGGVSVANAASVAVQLDQAFVVSMGAESAQIISNSTATWSFDTVTGVVTGSGTYIGQSQVSPTIPGQVFTRTIVDASWGGGSTAGATSYNCVDGSFQFAVGASFCGNYTFGPNFANDSTINYTGTSFSRTIGGDDVIAGPQGNLGDYNGMTTTVSGSTVTLSNLTFSGTTLTGGQRLVYSIQVVPVPAAVWLFGSALGLLGWVRRRTA